MATDIIARGMAANATGRLNKGTHQVPVPSAFPLDQSKASLTLGMDAGLPYGTINNAPSLIPAAVWGAPVATQVFHVDPVNGSNANSGIGAYYGDFSLAVKDVATAISKANTTTIASRIVIEASTSPSFTRALGGVGTSTYATVDIAIDAMNGRATFTSADAHTWALDGTFTNCYSATESNASGAIDLANQRWLGDAQGSRLYDRNGVGRQAYVEFVKYATPTALNTATLTGTTGGGYVNSGGKTYVRRADGAVVTDVNSRVFRGTTTIAPAFSTGTASSSKSLYMSGCDFQGGFLSTNAGTRNVVLTNCRAFYANLDMGQAGNGFACDMIGAAVFIGCEGWCCGNDIFNPHGVNGALQYVVVNGLGWDTGRGTGQSNNGITGHESCIVVDIGGDYQLTRGGTARIINNAQLLLFGTRLLNDLGDVILGGSIVPTTVMANDNSRIFAFYCTISSTNRALYAPDTNSRIYTLGNTILAGTSTGNVVPVTG